MKWLGGQFIEVNFWSMMLDILNMIILPIVAGFIFNLFFKNTETARHKIIQLDCLFLIITRITSLVYLRVKQTGMAGFIRTWCLSMVWFYLLPMMAALVIRYF